MAPPPQVDERRGLDGVPRGLVAARREAHEDGLAAQDFRDLVDLTMQERVGARLPQHKDAVLQLVVQVPLRLLAHLEAVADALALALLQRRLVPGRVAAPLVSISPLARGPELEFAEQEKEDDDDHRRDEGKGGVQQQEAALRAVVALQVEVQEGLVGCRGSMALPVRVAGPRGLDDVAGQSHAHPHVVREYRRPSVGVERKRGVARNRRLAFKFSIMIIAVVAVEAVQTTLGDDLYQYDDHVVLHGHTAKVERVRQGPHVLEAPLQRRRQRPAVVLLHIHPYKALKRDLRKRVGHGPQRGQRVVARPRRRRDSGKGGRDVVEGQEPTDG
ncbi:hypothetical protein M885DRAFT_513218 [Pelagophyceae sp. CCMP2097]|nr:hypothetical protein M885DRAFT_513218 [Pelagophyceae sp. CCMP2097]